MAPKKRNLSLQVTEFWEGDTKEGGGGGVQAYEILR